MRRTALEKAKDHVMLYSWMMEVKPDAINAAKLENANRELGKLTNKVGIVNS